MSKIIDSDKNHLTLLNDNGSVETVVNDDYYHLKYDRINMDMRDETDRILYKFTNQKKIHETYNRKIFNLTYRGKIITTRQDDAVKICSFIVNRDEEGFVSFFLERYQVENRKELIKSLLAPFEKRLKFSRGGVIVDDTFRVRYDGGADVRVSTNGGGYWKSLCLVVEDYMRAKKMHTAIGIIDMSILLQTIYLKVGFCLKPIVRGKEAHIFMNQLPKKLQQCLLDEWG
jgi:hypothetical protein